MELATDSVVKESILMEVAADLAAGCGGVSVDGVDCQFGGGVDVDGIGHQFGSSRVSVDGVGYQFGGKEVNVDGSEVDVNVDGVGVSCQFGGSGVGQQFSRVIANSNGRVEVGQQFTGGVNVVINGARHQFVGN